MALKLVLLNKPQFLRIFVPVVILSYMKSLLKFALLSALIIGGKLAKQSAPAVAAQPTQTQAAPGASILLVHQVLTSEPVKPARQQAPPQSGNGLITEMY